MTCPWPARVATTTSPRPTDGSPRPACGPWLASCRLTSRWRTAGPQPADRWPVAGLRLPAASPRPSDGWPAAARCRHVAHQPSACSPPAAGPPGAGPRPACGHLVACSQWPAPALADRLVASRQPAAARDQSTAIRRPARSPVAAGIWPASRRAIHGQPVTRGRPAACPGLQPALTATHSQSTASRWLSHCPTVASQPVASLRIAHGHPETLAAGPRPASRWTAAPSPPPHQAQPSSQTVSLPPPPPAHSPTTAPVHMPWLAAAPVAVGARLPTGIWG